MDPGSGASLNDLVQLAQRALMAGRLDEAAQTWERVLAISPEHSHALLNLGQYALSRRDTVKAREFLERAEKAEPKEPAIPYNLSFVFKAAGDANGESGALTRALTADPYFFPALLAKGMLLERMGRRRQAAELFRNVLKIAPPLEQLPGAMQKSLAYAQDRMRENVEELDAFLRARLEPMRKRHGNENLTRFEECKDIATGAKKVFTQQPSKLHFPGLPAIQFYDNADFPWLQKLEAATGIIRDELLTVLREDSKDFHPYVNHPDGAPINQWRELNHSPRWSAFHLWKDGNRNEEQCNRCPRTAALLDELPMLDLSGFGPTVMFSCLAPHTRIPAHSSVTNVRLVVHLPLIVPGKCFFRVGNETREWQYGKAWIFDDTMEHEAWNDSDELRVILMIDIWNPYLSPAERELVTALLNGVLEYYKSDQPAVQLGG